MDRIEFISSATQLPVKNIQSTLHLFDDDCSIPFIARYRKEATGNLDEVAIGKIFELKSQFETLEKRKISILKALEEQEVLNPDLEEKIKAASEIHALEDLYLPYKKRRKTKAEKARRNGLEPLAKMIMSQKVKHLGSLASQYLNEEIIHESEALEGARHIIAEWINERQWIRNKLRSVLAKNAILNTRVVNAQSDDEKALKFKDYFLWSEALRNIPSHRYLAIQRAEREGFIRVSLDIDSSSFISEIKERIRKTGHETTEQIDLSIEDSFKRLLYPSLSNETLQNAKAKADLQAISVFSKNLQQLLLGAPLGEKRILAIDPGFRTGCKMVCLNESGGLLYNETIYPHPPKNDSKGAIKKINSLVDAYRIEAIAIGNGTASRETERLVRRIRFSEEIEVFVVSEAGASIYSASKIARQEFPNYDVTVRGAVSIGRRLSDPLAELVKIEPKSIGVGQYQHDVDQVQLKKSLDTVVESCVNSIGVNINTASISLLSYVSGIGDRLARNIVEFRKENGSFTDREQFKKVPRLGDKAFEQSAGFLRIRNPQNPLDNSSVHPESYPIVLKMARDVKKPLQELIGNKILLRQIDLSKYCTDQVGLPTLQDIVKELEKPGNDPRKKARMFTFDQNIKTIDDLKPGQLLPGIINNITNFGCFVDLGIKESGLIHVSNLSDQYVRDVNEVVHLHQQVIVRVLEIDKPRKRIQLALKSS